MTRVYKAFDETGVMCQQIPECVQSAPVETDVDSSSELHHHLNGEDLPLPHHCLGPVDTTEEVLYERADGRPNRLPPIPTIEDLKTKLVFALHRVEESCEGLVSRGSIRLHEERIYKCEAFEDLSDYMGILSSLLKNHKNPLDLRELQCKRILLQLEELERRSFSQHGAGAELLNSVSTSCGSTGTVYKEHPCPNRLFSTRSTTKERSRSSSSERIDAQCIRFDTLRDPTCDTTDWTTACKPGCNGNTGKDESPPEFYRNRSDLTTRSSTSSMVPHDTMKETCGNQIIERIPGVRYNPKKMQWIAAWNEAGSKEVRKYFSIKQYGFEGARRFAMACRKDAEERGARQRSSTKLLSAPVLGLIKNDVEDPSGGGHLRKQQRRQTRDYSMFIQSNRSSSYNGDTAQLHTAPFLNISRENDATDDTTSHECDEKYVISHDVSLRSGMEHQGSSENHYIHPSRNDHTAASDLILSILHESRCGSICSALPSTQAPVMEVTGQSPSPQVKYEMSVMRDHHACEIADPGVCDAFFDGLLQEPRTQL